MLHFFGYVTKILLTTLCIEAKSQRLKESTLRNTKQNVFKDRNKSLGFVLKIRWPKLKPKDKKLRRRPISRVIGRSLYKTLVIEQEGTL